MASQAESASRDAMTERLQTLLAPYEALQAELASRKAMIDEFEAAARAELASRYTAMLEIEDTQVEMASLKATKEEYKVFEANAKEVVLKKVEAVREAMAQQCKEMQTDYTMRYWNMANDMAAGDSKTALLELEVSRDISLILTVLTKYRITRSRLLISWT
jgi:hypothetical protein